MPVLGQILEEAMQKNYLEKEMVDTGKFIDQLLDRLSVDGIVEIPMKLCLQIFMSVLHAGTLKE